jgi:hypothetical protein
LFVTYSAEFGCNRKKKELFTGIKKKDWKYLVNVAHPDNMGFY